jgi:hypothetical protein
VTGAGWTATPRGRRELAAVGLVCLAFAVIPLVTTELYPFSRAPMFADAPQQYCDYAVVTPDGRRLIEPQDLLPLGLQRNYWGNPLGVGVGFQPAESVDVFGAVATPGQVADMVTARLRRFPQWEYVEVEQSVIGKTDADHVGVVRSERWRVDNPFYKPGGGS